MGKDSSNTVRICQYLFSISLSPKCQSISSLVNYGFGQLKISDSQYFLLGSDPTSHNLHFYKITFEGTNVDWAKKMQCYPSSCQASMSESLLSADENLIYSFFAFGDIRYCYFASFFVSTGSINGSRYKSSLACENVYGSVLAGNYIIAASDKYPSTYLIMLNLISSSFQVRQFTGTNLNQAIVDLQSSRVIILGAKSSIAYITKFFPESIPAHPDFTSSTLSMNLLPAGTEDITSESGVTLSFALVNSVSTASYTSQTIIFILYPQILSDVYFQVSSETFTITENNVINFIPEVCCSAAGTTTISFSISQYNSETPPTFVRIDASYGVLSGTSPSVASTKTFSFYLDSNIASANGPVQKMVSIIVNKCTVTNCQRCTPTSGSTCAICNTGYSLISGTCQIIQEAKTSQTAESLKTISQSILGATAVIVLITSVLNASSFASMWSLINQMQIYFFILLAGIFVPIDVKTVILGMKICVFPFEFVLPNSLDTSSFLNNYFDIKFWDERLDIFGINSGSTIVNISSFIYTLLLAVILHLITFILFKIISKQERAEESLFSKALKFCITKVYLFFTFGFYIRTILESNQYMLVSSISEISQFSASKRKEIFSLCIAFSVITFCICTLFAIIYLIFKMENISEENSTKFEEFFSNIKPQRKTRFFVIFLLSRRIIFVIITITIVPRLTKVNCVHIISGIQLVYFLIICFLRPYKNFKSNVIEVLNEMYFTVLFSSLIFLSSETKWSETVTSVYIWILSSNSMLVFVIIMIDSIKQFVNYIKFKCSKSAVQPEQNDRSEFPTHLSNQNAESRMTRPSHLETSNKHSAANYTAEEVKQSHIKVYEIRGNRFEFVRQP